MQELIESIKGGDASRLGELYDQNRGLLYRLATRYLNVDNMVTRDDLMQSGFFGLCDAVSAWDPERGAWSTIAHFHVRKAMRDAVGLHGTRIRAHNVAISLDAPIPGDEDGDSARHDTLADETLPDPDEAMIDAERCTALYEALGRLAQDRAEAVRLHDLEGQTYDDVGAHMGVTRQQAHNLRAYALRDLARDWQLKKQLDEETRFGSHKGVTAFLSDWTSSTEEAALWRIDKAERLKRREREYEEWLAAHEREIVAGVRP